MVQTEKSGAYPDWSGHGLGLGLAVSGLGLGLVTRGLVKIPAGIAVHGTTVASRTNHLDAQRNTTDEQAAETVVSWNLVHSLASWTNWWTLHNTEDVGRPRENLGRPGGH